MTKSTQTSAIARAIADGRYLDGWAGSREHSNGERVQRCGVFFFVSVHRAPGVAQLQPLLFLQAEGIRLYAGRSEGAAFV